MKSGYQSGTNNYFSKLEDSLEFIQKITKIPCFRNARAGHLEAPSLSCRLFPVYDVVGKSVCFDYFENCARQFNFSTSTPIPFS
jgi:hypothetical protein